MFVKRLEIYGFKSFADKTTFELTPGVTVVVGPNGCGKSNITDAVRWVLGEQSARHLRGARMDDIIFGGTANRKPLSFAEVSITMDHSDGSLGLDYQEVTVTRRIYKNGESEYLLNRRPYRLKDIHELFMDTGIGKEAYSFIGQGRVDELLNAKPEERRQIFEEAAGIIKYKNRKREAERRLAETAENLLRLGDIIHELSAQAGPLERQADVARRYLALRDELKQRDVDLLVHDARTLRSRWYELDAKVKTAADELLEQQTSISRRENAVAENQLALDEAQSAVAELQRDVQKHSSELEKAQSRIAVTKEKIRGVERQIHEATLATGELTSRRTDIEADLTANQDRTKNAADAVLRIRGELAQAEQALLTMENSAEALRAAAGREELDRILLRVRRLQTDHDRLEMETEQLASDREKLSGQRKAMSEEADLLSSALGTVRDEIHTLKNGSAALTAALNEKRAKLAEQALFIETLLAKRKQAEKVLLETESRLRLLTELDDAMAGYFQGVKTVLAAKKEEPKRYAGVCGTVADLVQVPAAYVTAVEAALGAGLQNLVTDTESTAKEAIALLKRVKGGRATFLPLNILTPQPRRQAPYGLAAMSGYIGVAADLVRCEPQYRPVLESLLGRVHLVRDLDAAVEAARLNRFAERVVTLEGDVILPGGAITGGAEKKQQGGVLSRRKEADTLRVAVQTRQEELSLLILQEEKAAEITSALNGELTELDTKLKENNLSLSMKESEQAFFKKQLDAATAVVAALDAQITAAGKQQAARLQTLHSMKKELASAMLEEETLRLEQARLSGILSAREQEKRVLRERFTECRVRLASVQKQQEHLEEERERLARELVALAERGRRSEEDMRGLRTALLELNDALAESREAASLLEEERNKRLAVLAGREKELKEKMTAFREESETLRQQEKSLAALERKVARQEMERGRVEVELQAVLDRLRDSWDLEFAEAEPLAGPLEDREATLKLARELKERIAALGTVNLGAIEEHKRVTERVDFLTVQRDDLLEGEKDLQRIIREIDSRMGEKFAASFAEINEAFGQVFKELFGGGRAYLRLTDPDNPLEAGVDMVAQPPGKKLQHLSLLSGGEKALTAISLLFAFLKTKPTPFCILDEIEAALDEANLAKFNNYLKTLAGQTQFIIISHRKKTMEQADILYGVTMEESGISKIISVRLRDNSPAAGATA